MPDIIPVVVWHDLTQIPASLLRVFRDPALYSLLCPYCKCSANVKCGDAALERIFCESCQVKLGQAPQFACQGAHASCMRTRFVDPLGRVAPLCRGCHRGRSAQN